MQQIVDYLEKSTAEFVEKILGGFNRTVVVYRESEGRGGWFLVLDSPEYDLEWHQMSFRIDLFKPITGVLTGNIEVERYAREFKDDERRVFPFNRGVPF